jgi:hypothetical protein
MGESAGGTSTSGPSRYVDHTTGVQAALTYLSGLGGGTLVFPCAPPSGDTLAIYNIRQTINVPSNVTIQGEGAEELGTCRIYWHDVSWNPGLSCYDNPDNNTYPLRNKPMFKIAGGVSGVRFRDIWLYSRSSGYNCYPRTDRERIASDGISAIEMNTTAGSSNITDVIFENVAITNFTTGIKAVTNNATDSEISNIRIRGYKPSSNYRQLYIDSKNAYNWDIQNLNISGMMEAQAGVEIINAGKPSAYTGPLGKIKFAFLNCNGSADRDHPPAFCVKVEKHGGLYFRQLHHEGVPKALDVEDISARSAPNTNSDPIVLEASVASGNFKDASMKLYLVGNGILTPDAVANGLDDARLRFTGGGLSSTVVDCGDGHSDWTDVQDDGNPSDPATWDDLKMLYSHMERNRASFFADAGSGNKYNKPHTYCPSGVSGLTNINEVGGDFFDNGVMPTEAGADNAKQYANVLNSSTCSSLDADACLATAFSAGGSIYMDGSFTANHMITIPRGVQITGSPGSQIQFVSNGSTTGADTALFRINILVLSISNQFRSSGIVIRNLKLKTTENGLRGLDMKGENDAAPGVASDYHLSGLTIEGFDTGFYAGRYSSTTGHPMIDGISLKNMSFVNNDTSVEVDSSNISNWNVMDLSLATSNTNTDKGWYQTYGGHIGFQDVSCTGGASFNMADCVRLQMSSVFINGLRKTLYVTNALNIAENGNVHTGTVYEAPVPTSLVVRNSDFTSSGSTSVVKVTGKSFITSMNNKYTNFDIGSTYGGNISRLTYCDDTYSGTPYSTSLADTHPNLWVGVPTVTRIPCGTRPRPYEDVVTLGGNSGDKPLVGNFYDNTREDLVIYRAGSSAQFLIKTTDGTATQTISWGTTGDVGLVGRFFPGSRAQIVIWRPSNGQWWVNDPNNGSNNSVWTWGTSGDIPFVGNFLDESGSVSGNMDEIGVYRPSTDQFWILNPRSGGYVLHTLTTAYGSNIQVGDFNGSGYDQVAQYVAGSTSVWRILDARTGGKTSGNFGTTGDVPVPGKYKSGSCTQMGVWRPSDQKFYVADLPACGSQSGNIVWGSNNDFNSTAYTDDIPLTINNAAGTLRRPTAYRPTKGAFPASISNGQWWIHDTF